MYEDYARPLTPKEYNKLEKKLASLRQDRKKLKRWHIKFFVGMLAILYVILVIAMLREDKTQELASPFPWAFFAGVIAIAGSLSYISDLRKTVASARRLESAIRGNKVRVLHIQADVMYEIEEEDDEGACYAFQVEDNRIIFLCGQEYYSTRSFPNTDFCLVDILSEDDEPVDEEIYKNGMKLKPTRMIPAVRKAQLRWVDHLETIEGRLEDIEQLLANSHRLKTEN